MEPKSPSKLKLSITGSARSKWVLKICVVSLVILLLLVSCYFAFGLGKGSALAESEFYTVVVDCGSTGTRVNVYKWKTSSLDSRGLPILMHSYPDYSNESQVSRSSCRYHCMQSEPGLDKFTGNATGVRVSLEPLIRLAERWVPHERHRYTPIFVLATAGLRRLRSEDARQVLADVEAVIKEHAFVYGRAWIRVLSGNEEAYYGWVALNYKMGNLGNSSRGPTSGLLDIGGSSLQVVMEIDGEMRDDAHLMRSEIGLVEHQILAYSFPSFGLNEAFDRTVAMLSQAQPGFKNSSGRLEVRHPCLSSNFVQNYTCSTCHGLNSTYENNLGSDIHKTEYTLLIGDPDWERCKGVARAAAINSSNSDWSQPIVGKNCRASLPFYGGSNFVNLTNGTHYSGHFHALSGFFAVYNILNLAARANLTKVWEKGQQLCLESWTHLSSFSGNHNNIGQYCFRVPYMASLIEDALCLGDQEIIFGPADLSWTLGAALIEGEYLWLRTSKAGTSSWRNMEVVYSPIFVFFLLLGLLFIVYFSKFKLPMPVKKVPAIGPSLPSYIYPKRRPN